MIITLPVLVPLVLGLLALLVTGQQLRFNLLYVAVIVHPVTVFMVRHESSGWMSDWLAMDPLGLLMLSVTSVVFAAAGIYAVGYLKRESGHEVQDAEEGFWFNNEPEAIFVSCLLFLLATMSLVCLSHHLGLLWVAIEATTLVSAPLITLHRHHRSLEAAWKYLLICSVGIALALLGNIFLAYAGHGQVHLQLEVLTDFARQLDPLWLKAAFLMILVGYGTKMGLVPMHTWLPDAHSEAPSMISMMLSSGLLNCALLGILRVNSILNAAGLGEFSGRLLVLFGLFSMLWAAVFLVRQIDYKRMLAYSSVEHMGILAVGVGIGGLASDGAMLHIVCHSLTKGMLFLTAGHILYVFHTKNPGQVCCLLHWLPWTGVFWLVGFLAITGAPPFGLFFSELMILKGIVQAGGYWVAAGYLLALCGAFFAMARIVLPMTYGVPGSNAPRLLTSSLREPAWYVLPVLALAVGCLMFGIWVPEGIRDLMHQAAFLAGAQR